MIDGKMAGLLQGDTGHSCHYCYSSQKSYNEIDQIKEGFRIDKSYKRCNTDYFAQTSRIKRGQKHEPIIKTDLRFFAITHTLMRSLDNILKIYYRLIAGDLRWGAKAEEGKVKDAKSTAQKHIQKTCKGLKIDSPSNAGGTTNVGNTAMRFFDCDNRDAICSLIPGNNPRLRNVY
jgi:hypothetical protein